MKLLFSAGGLVYKKENGLWFLLIRTKGLSGKLQWQIPKGKIEKDEDEESAAQREVREETGAQTKLKQKLLEIKYFFKADKDFFKKTVSFFLMEYAGGELRPQEGEVEEVKWFEPDEALKLVTYKNERKVLDKALEILV